MGELEGVLTRELQFTTSLSSPYFYAQKVIANQNNRLFCSMLQSVIRDYSPANGVGRSVQLGTWYRMSETIGACLIPHGPLSPSGLGNSLVSEGMEQNGKCHNGGFRQLRKTRFRCA